VNCKQNSPDCHPPAIDDELAMAKKVLYIVVQGRVPGVYTTWLGPDGAAAQVTGFTGALYKGFTNHQHAREWLNEIGHTEFVDEFLPSPGKKACSKTPVLPDQRPAAAAKQPLQSGPVSRKQGEIKSAAAPDPMVRPHSSINKPKLDTVTIYTDGGALKNPGPGGFGVVLLHKKTKKELSVGFRLTTNNRMELMACIEGLKALKYTCAVTMYSDSKYVINGIEKGWAKRWKKKGWMRDEFNKAKNADLWQLLLDLCQKHNVSFKWVKGHSGDQYNEICDQLAQKAARHNARNIDTVFEQTLHNPEK